MRVAVALRAVCAVLSVGAAMTACDTDAQGVEDCRDIERARCRAARYCDVGIESDEDVAACERFMRDNCLHGFEVPDEASSSELRDCVQAIAAAGTCAQDGDGDAMGVDARARACGGVLATTVAGSTACEVVDRPELHPACQFLVAEPPVAEDSGAPPAPEPDPEPADGGA